MAFNSSGENVLVALPDLTMSTKLTDLPEAFEKTRESLTTTSDVGMPSMPAPASLSAIRPAAPTRLIKSKFIIVDQLPPVMFAASTGSLYFGSLPTRLTRISPHDAPSSSATICAMVLAMCCPMSALPTFTVTMPSGAIEYQMLGSKGAADPTAAAAGVAPGSVPKPKTRPDAPAVIRNERRERSGELKLILVCL